jgi:mRNA interferase MazF
VKNINQFEIWVADLSPQIGTEPGKVRPVVVIQTDLLNIIPHPSTIICPITTNVETGSQILKVHLKKGEGNVLQDCDIMIDHIRAIDNKRLVRKVGELSQELKKDIKDNIKIVLDLE